MLITKKVEVVLSSANIDYYENLGYQIERTKDSSYRKRVKRGTKLLVNIEHVPKNSNTEVEIMCDYCKIKYNRKYYSYNKSKSKEIIKKDSCYACRYKKAKESNLVKYGVENIMNIEEVVEKIMSQKRIDFNQVKTEFKNVGFELLCDESYYKNSNQRLPCKCIKHPNIIQYKYRKVVAAGYGCKICDQEKRIGENSPSWKGGITPIYNYLRGCLSNWKKESMELCNHKCVVTQAEDYDIHHIFSFNLILKELLNISNIKIKQDVSDYTDDELTILKNTLRELHYKNGLGICIHTKLHSLFHTEYGDNNDKKQILDFLNKINNGKYDDFLEEHNIKININNDIINKL